MDRGGGEVHGVAVVTAATTLAAQRGIEILESGGTAFDAALGAALIECVELPMKCGLAGDVVALVKRSGLPAQALISVGRGASGHRPGALSVTGPRSVGIPGAPAGYMALARLGRLPVERLAAPAIELARRGPSWSGVAAALTTEAAPLLRRWNGPLRYLPAGDVPAVGVGVPLPGLASVIEQFAETGEHLFRGALGERVRQRLGEDCLLSAADFETATASWCRPQRLERSGVVVEATPAPTDGAPLLRALALAFDGLHPREAARRARSGADAGTSVVTAADAEGNAVVLVHSNSFPRYGSAVVVEELDLVLNNRPGRGFDITASSDHPNAAAPGRMPKTTLHAWALHRDGHTFFGATPGGVNQLCWNLQAVLSLQSTDSVEYAATAPRWELSPSGGGWNIEADHPEAGHGWATVVPPLSLRSVMQVLSRMNGETGWRAAADPRLGAAARSSMRADCAPR